MLSLPSEYSGWGSSNGVSAAQAFNYKVNSDENNLFPVVLSRLCLVLVVDRLVIQGVTGQELTELFVSAHAHALQLSFVPRIEVYRSEEGEMSSERTMQTSAV